MDDPLTESQVTAIREGGLRFYLYGTVFYEDVFGADRRTEFCYYMRVEGHKVMSLASEHGNDAT